jgi:hypothetical protein
MGIPIPAVLALQIQVKDVASKAITAGLWDHYKRESVGYYLRELLIAPSSHVLTGDNPLLLGLL